MIADLNETQRPALRRLVQAAMAQPCPASAESVKEYDWKSPSRFTPPQIQKLTDGAGEMAQAVSEALTGLLKMDPKLGAGPVTQHYAADLEGPEGGEAHFLVPLAGEDGRRCGWVFLPLPTACAWVARLLGGSSLPAPTELSPLERSLLVDIVSASATAVSAILRKGGAKPIRAQDAILQRLELAADDLGQEYCRFPLGSLEPGGKAACDLVLLSDWVAPLAASETKATVRAPADVQKDLMSHLSQVSVEASAMLGVATVLLQDVMSLEAGDVLVTQTRVGEPIVLEVEGQAVLKAVPVFSDGCYALKVTELVRFDLKKRS